MALERGKGAGGGPFRSQIAGVSAPPLVRRGGMRSAAEPKERAHGIQLFHGPGVSLRDRKWFLFLTEGKCGRPPANRESPAHICRLLPISFRLYAALDVLLSHWSCSEGTSCCYRMSACSSMHKRDVLPVRVQRAQDATGEMQHYSVP